MSASGLKAGVECLLQANDSAMPTGDFIGLGWPAHLDECDPGLFIILFTDALLGDNKDSIFVRRFYK